MAKIEIEIKDNVYDELKKFCEDTGLTENALFAMYANKVAAEKIVPFEIRSFCHRADFSGFIKKASPEEIVKALLKMDDYFCAVFLSGISSNYSSTLIENLPEERSSNILSIIAKGITATDDIFRAVEKCISSEILSEATSPIRKTDGINDVVKILNLVKPETLRSVIRRLEESDAETAENVKKNIFVFEDIVIFDDRDVQKILRELSLTEIALALKNASEETREKFYRNLSKDDAKKLKEDLEFMGPVKLKDVDQMQSRIVAIIRRMEEKGEFYIPHGHSDEYVC